MAERMTKKERAYQLFSEGKDSSSPGVKALGLKFSTRYSYCSTWPKEGGPLSAPGTPSLMTEETRKKPRATVASKAISELEMIAEPTEEVNEEKEPEIPESKEKPKRAQA